MKITRIGGKKRVQRRKRRAYSPILDILKREGGILLSNNTLLDFGIGTNTRAIAAIARAARLEKPLGMSEIDIAIENELKTNCTLVLRDGISYPATWEDTSSLELYYCSDGGFFVIREVESLSDGWISSYTVKKNIDDVVEKLNSALEMWADRLAEHSTLEVPGAEESGELAEELRRSKYTREDIEKALANKLTILG